MANKKFPKRKRRFNTLGKDGKELAFIDMGLRKTFPNVKKRLEYVRALIADFDRQLAKK